MFRFLLWICVVGLAGCSSSRIVLLENTKPGSAIVVSAGNRELILDQPNTYTELNTSTASLSAVKPLAKETLTQKYRTLMAMTPEPPVSFLLYFKPDSVDMTEASTAILSSIETAVLVRSPCVVNIIGHSDSTGSRQYNIKLSLQRAQAVRAWLQDQNLGILRTNVTSYGEEDPLVPTADGVAEPKNRRVEIMIR